MKTHWEETLTSLELLRDHWERVRAQAERSKEQAEQAISTLITAMMLVECPPRSDSGGGEIVSTSPNDTMAIRPPDDDEKESLAERIRKLFQQNPASILSVPEVAKLLGGQNEKSVGAAMTRLFIDEFIVRVSRGKYRFNPAYKLRQLEASLERKAS